MMINFFKKFNQVIQNQIPPQIKLIIKLIYDNVLQFYNVETNDFEFKTDKDFIKEVLDEVGNDKILSNKVKTNNKIYKIDSELM